MRDERLDAAGAFRAFVVVELLVARGARFVPAAGPFFAAFAFPPAAGARFVVDFLVAIRDSPSGHCAGAFR